MMWITKTNLNHNIPISKFAIQVYTLLRRDGVCLDVVRLWKRRSFRLFTEPDTKFITESLIFRLWELVEFKTHCGLNGSVCLDLLSTDHPDSFKVNVNALASDKIAFIARVNFWILCPLINKWQILHFKEETKMAQKTDLCLSNWKFFSFTGHKTLQNNASRPESDVDPSIQKWQLIVHRSL